MSALIMAVHRISQLQLPLIVLGAGLPQLVGLTGLGARTDNERSAEFPNDRFRPKANFECFYDIRMSYEAHLSLRHDSSRAHIEMPRQGR